MTFSYLALGWKQNIEDATWVLIIVSSKVLEERENLKKELLGKKEFKLFGRFSTYLDCKKMMKHELKGTPRVWLGNNLIMRLAWI